MNHSNQIVKIKLFFFLMAFLPQNILYDYMEVGLFLTFIHESSRLLLACGHQRPTGKKSIFIKWDVDGKNVMKTCWLSVKSLYGR